MTCTRDEPQGEAVSLVRATGTGGKTRQVLKNLRLLHQKPYLVWCLRLLLCCWQLGRGRVVPSAWVPSACAESGPGCSCRLVPVHCKTSPFCTGNESDRVAPLGQAPAPILSGTAAVVSRVQTPMPGSALRVRSRLMASARERGDPRWQHELAVQREQIMLFIYSVCCLNLMETEGWKGK